MLERLDIQRGYGQTMHKYRSLTHNLQSKQSKDQNHNICSNRPQMVGTSVSNHLLPLIFVPTYNLEPAETAKYVPMSDLQKCPTFSQLTSNFPTSLATIRGYIKTPHFVHYKAFPPTACLGFCQMQMIRSIPLIEQALNKC